MIECGLENLESFERCLSTDCADEITRAVADEFVLHKGNRGSRVAAVNSRLRGSPTFYIFCAGRK